MQLPLQTQDLNLSGCNQIPSDAWEVLRTANWSNLQKAFFQEWLGQEKGVAMRGWLQLHCSSCVDLRLFVFEEKHAKRKDSTKHVSTFLRIVNVWEA